MKLEVGRMYPVQFFLGLPSILQISHCAKTEPPEFLSTIEKNFPSKIAGNLSGELERFLLDIVKLRIKYEL